MTQPQTCLTGARGLAVVVVAMLGLAGCDGSQTNGDASAGEAATIDRIAGRPSETGPATDVASPSAAMQACNTLVDDGLALAAVGGNPTVEKAYTVRPADLKAWWEEGSSGPLTRPGGAPALDDDTPVTICLVHADVVAAPGHPDMTDEYQWELTAILGDGTPRPLTASVTRPTDLPPTADPDR